MPCKHDDGKWYEYPEHPIQGHNRYSPHETCPTCGFKSNRYTRNGACVTCSRNQSIAFYNFVCGAADPLRVMVGREIIRPDESQWNVLMPLRHNNPSLFKIQTEPCEKAGHIGMRYVSNGKCVLCEVTKELSPRQKAKQAGEMWYTPDEPCTKCNTTAQRRVDNGDCAGCRDAARALRSSDSPRKEAVRSGETWYTPVKPCEKCGQKAPRRVANGECSGCKHKPVSARKKALQAGESWYESDRVCECGRNLWLYVANGRVRRCECGR